MCSITNGNLGAVAAVSVLEPVAKWILQRADLGAHAGRYPLILKPVIIDST